MPDPISAGAFLAGQGIQAGGNIIGSILNYWASRKQMEADREYNQLMLEQADIERDIQGKQFMKRYGLEKMDADLRQRKFAWESDYYNQKLGMEKDATQYNRMLGLSNNIKGFFAMNPQARQRLTQIQQMRRAA